MIDDESPESSGAPDNILPQQEFENLDGQLDSASSHSALAIADDLSTSAMVADQLRQLMPALGRSDPAAAIVTWLCDVCPSSHSRKAYLGDLAEFTRHLESHGVHPLQVTSDHVALYKEAMRAAGKRPATVARVLSVLRGAYQQFGKKGLLNWDTVSDIQAVTSPRVKKNTTPALSESEAKALLHAPDTATLIGCRDHAMLFAYFKTTSRASAIAYATIGDLERTDTDWYLMVTEKGGKQERKSLLDAAPAVLKWLKRAGLDLAENAGHPLFPPMASDRKTVAERHMTTRQVLNIVKKYARKAGIQVDRQGRRDVCTHSLRKSSITNALNNGATMQQAKALAGHASIRTTELYYEENEKDADEAARRIQIR